MKICLYSPYFPKHIGGGEKYFLDAAFALSRHGKVFLSIPLEEVGKEEEIYERYEKFLGKSIRNLTIIGSPLHSQKASFWQKIFWTKQFDLLYAFTDGSFFPSLARKNVLHIQTPLKRPSLSFWERCKFYSWDFVNTNSFFTKNVVEKFWKIPVNAVHHPTFDVEGLENLQKKYTKEKIILHVGRFFRQLHSKRQDILIEFFKELVQKSAQKIKNWKLVLIGSVEDENYAQEIRSLAQGYPIEVIHTVSREELNVWYARASIYWHATGYGLDEHEQPEKMEHFGISTGEAMAAGAVPVVIHSGGQPEVLGEELAQWLWDDKTSCLEKTLKLVDNEKERKEWSRKSTKRAHVFSVKHFEKNIDSMIENLRL